MGVDAALLDASPGCGARRRRAAARWGPCTELGGPRCCRAHGAPRHRVAPPRRPPPSAGLPPPAAAPAHRRAPPSLCPEGSTSEYRAARCSASVRALDLVSYSSGPSRALAAVAASSPRRWQRARAGAIKPLRWVYVSPCKLPSESTPMTLVSLSTATPPSPRECERPTVESLRCFRLGASAQSNGCHCGVLPQGGTNGGRQCLRPQVPTASCSSAACSFLGGRVMTRLGQWAPAPTTGASSTHATASIPAGPGRSVRGRAADVGLTSPTRPRQRAPVGEWVAGIPPGAKGDG